MSGVDSVGFRVQLACIWEASARKAGNVHRFRDAHDTTYLDFLTTAAAIGPVFERATEVGVGQTALDAIRAAKAVAGVNVNLGIVLLLAPLAAVPADVDLRTGIQTVLAQLDLKDTQQVYEAIRLANPGGLGKVERHDVHEVPDAPLREAMLVAHFDQVARQYVNDFAEVLDVGIPALKSGIGQFGGVEEAIVYCHLDLLKRFGDGLIVRKAGPGESQEAAQQAQEVLAAGWPHTLESRRRFADFDNWLRSDGNRRNPGTTADLVAASLFVALREGILKVPLALPWSAGLL